MLRINIETIPHDHQRYPTVGDWMVDHPSGVLTIRVSNMNNWKFELLVAIHELIEQSLCMSDQITQAKVDAFDLMFENERDHAQHDVGDEPGDDPRCPYRRQHFVATNIERQMADALGVDWLKYERKINSL